MACWRGSHPAGALRRHGYNSHQVAVVPLLQGVPDEQPVLRVWVVIQQQLHSAVAIRLGHAPTAVTHGSGRKMRTVNAFDATCAHRELTASDNGTLNCNPACRPRRCILHHSDRLPGSASGIETHVSAGFAQGGSPGDEVVRQPLLLELPGFVCHGTQLRRVLARRERGLHACSSHQLCRAAMAPTDCHDCPPASRIDVLCGLLAWMRHTGLWS